jgi:dTDP-4-dehydrorhamnose reductase
VGQALIHALQPWTPVIAASRELLDLAAVDSLAEKVCALAPRAIINTAAYTAVDKAETESELARQINAAALEPLAQAARSLGIPILHYSTDYVFDGVARVTATGEARPWRESDPTAPLSVYGHTKRDGERILAASGAEHYIFRTAWVYASYGRNFLLTMLKLGASRDTLSVVNDQIGAPTTARYIARTTSSILQTLLTQSVPMSAGVARTGTYHLTMAGAISWFEFAQAIFSRWQAQNPGTKVPEVVPIPTRDYPTPARRPAYSVLDNERLIQTFGVVQAHWESGLEETLAELRVPPAKA